MARILLYGANGRTGQHVLTQALQRGHQVTVLVRDAQKVTIKSPSLNIIQGLTTNLKDLRRAIAGCDTVISTLGALHQSEMLSLGKIDPPHVLEQSIRNTIECMKEAGMRRIIIQTAHGAGESYQYSAWIMKMLIRYTRFQVVYADHNIQEQLLRDAHLDWTFVRPVGLNDKEELKELHVTFDSTPPSFQISRKHVAKFMLDCLDSNQYILKAPTISEG